MCEVISDAPGLALKFLNPSLIAICLAAAVAFIEWSGHKLFLRSGERALPIIELNQLVPLACELAKRSLPSET